MAVVSHHGIHELKIAALPWIRPTIGVRDDELVFATSGAALARIDRVRDGRAPDIRERVDFTSLGLGDRDAVEALAFGRMASGMGSFADLLGTAGFALSILPQDCESSGLLTIGTILTKLAPACRELDFGYDWAMEAMPGKAPNTWITRSVYRYHNQQ